MKAWMRDYMRKRRAGRKSLGLCTKCPDTDIQPIAKGSESLCEKHLLGMRLANRKEGARNTNMYLENRGRIKDQFDELRDILPSKTIEEIAKMMGCSMSLTIRHLNRMGIKSRGNLALVPVPKIPEIRNRTDISRQRKYQLERKAAGICGYCGVKPVEVAGMGRCAACNLIFRIKYKKKNPDAKQNPHMWGANRKLFIERLKQEDPSQSDEILAMKYGMGVHGMATWRRKLIGKKHQGRPTRVVINPMEIENSEITLKEIAAKMNCTTTTAFTHLQRMGYRKVWRKVMPAKPTTK